MIDQNNKRIFINTVMLYIRMVVIMLVTLYTSRVVLDVLGVDDYGIYIIVGSVVVSLNFIQSALNSATLRFISYELGKGQEGAVSKVFSMSLNIQVLFLLIILALLETIGVWFLNHVLIIPTERIVAANVVYQFSVLTLCVSILRVPYNAMIISFEKMSIYAVLSIVEAFLRLVIVYVILVLNEDKLIIYAILVFIVAFITNLFYIIYCRKLLKNNCTYRFEKDKLLFKQMISFSGWNLVGGITGVTTHEGPNYFMNIFIGVRINAAMGIAKQVGSAIYTFTENFQTAFRPQIVKYYASDEKQKLNDLIFNASKISFYLMFIIGFPILVSIDHVLDWWLVDVPKYATEFCVCMLLGYLVNAMSSPLWMLAHATGDIKKYQIAISLISLLIIPASVLFLMIGMEPYYILAFQIIINILIFAYRLIFAKNKVEFQIIMYIIRVLVPCFLQMLLIIPIPLALIFANVHWILVSVTSFIVSFAVFLLLGVPGEYRCEVISIIRKTIK